MQMLHRDMAQRAAEYDEHRRLKREIEKRKLELELAGLSSPTKPTQPTRRPLDFYEQQITAWFNRLPPEARAAPRTMEEFLNLLQGRTPGMRPHAPDLSRVLSSLGWIRKRNWKSDGAGVRLWWPTGSS
jgi:hypothetical protein